MVEKRKFEFYLLRYVPHAIRERFVEFGLIVKERAGDGFAGVRFADSWRDLKTLDPIADIDLLESLKKEIEGQFKILQDREVLMRWLEEAYSNAVQLTHGKTYETTDREGEIEMLSSLYLKELPIPQGAQSTELSGRQGILKEMRSKFEQFGVWNLLIHGVAAAEFTKAGDPFKFDFGYPVKDQKKIKLFHAVSLKGNVNAGITLAARYPEIESAMKTFEEPIEPVLTAVVDDGLPLTDIEIGFAIGMMKKHAIKVRPVAEMAEIAEEAKRELRA